MKISRFLLPVLVVAGFAVYLSLFTVKEINQAIVLQFGDPKRVIADTRSSGKNSFYSKCCVYRS